MLKHMRIVQKIPSYDNLIAKRFSHAVVYAPKQLTFKSNIGIFFFETIRFYILQFEGLSIMHECENQIYK